MKKLKAKAKPQYPECVKEIMEKEEKKSPEQKLREDIKSISEYLDSFNDKYTPKDLTYYYKRLPKARQELRELESPCGENKLNGYTLVDDSDDEEIIVKTVQKKKKELAVDFDSDDEDYFDGDDELF
jgi:hypothetical protein